jgi:hypothetical protein
MGLFNSIACMKKRRRPTYGSEQIYLLDVDQTNILQKLECFLYGRELAMAS